MKGHAFRFTDDGGNQADFFCKCGEFYGWQGPVTWDEARAWHRDHLDALAAAKVEGVASTREP